MLELVGLAAGAAAHDHHDEHPHGWKRWLLSTNHKDIGMMHLMFAMVGGGGSLAAALAARLAQARTDGAAG